jgi:hypothetical protein
MTTPDRNLLIALCVPASRQRRRLNDRERRDFTEDGALFFDGKRWPTVKRLYRLGLVAVGGNLYPNVKPTPAAWRYLGLECIAVAAVARA